MVAPPILQTGMWLSNIFQSKIHSFPSHTYLDSYESVRYGLVHQVFLTFHLHSKALLPQHNWHMSAENKSNQAQMPQLFMLEVVQWLPAWEDVLVLSFLGISAAKSGLYLQLAPTFRQSCGNSKVSAS